METPLWVQDLARVIVAIAEGIDVLCGVVVLDRYGLAREQAAVGFVVSRAIQFRKFQGNADAAGNGREIFREGLVGLLVCIGLPSVEVRNGARPREA